MAGYSARQSSYSDGDTITAAHTNDEILSKVISSIRCCICLDIVPSSTSPILSVPAIVLKPSLDKNNKSPPSS